MFERIIPIVMKEFYQIKRDIRTIGLVIFIPAFMLIMFGYALSFDVKNITLTVYDNDRSLDSRRFIDNFSQTDYFTLRKVTSGLQDIDRTLDANDSTVVLMIPEGFSNKLHNGEKADIQFLIDGTNSNTAGTVLGYIKSIVENYSLSVIAESATYHGRQTMVLPIDVRTRIWYNPEMTSVLSLITGLIGYILLITTVISTALSLVREWEYGTIEQIMVSPIKPHELIIGKTIPYVFISLITATLILVAGYMLFGVAVKGSLFILFVTTLLYIIVGLLLGLLISTVAESQQVAFMMSILITMLPTFILSGFIFPIRNMPVVIQAVTYVIPARYYMTIVRGVIVKGTGWVALWPSVLALLGIGCVFLFLGVRNLKKKLR